LAKIIVIEFNNGVRDKAKLVLCQSLNLYVYW